MFRVNKASVYFAARDGRAVQALDRVSLDIFPKAVLSWRWAPRAVASPRC